MEATNDIIFFADDIEIPFVRNELTFLSARYTSVVVVSQQEPGNKPELANVAYFSPDFSRYSTKKVLLRHFFAVAGIALKEFFSCKAYKNNFKLFLRSLSVLLRCCYRAEQVSEYLEKKSDKKFSYYTFWFNDWATTLSLLVKKKTIYGYISRAHGTDLFEERVPVLKHIPFRWFQLKYASKVASVSKKGSDYLKEKYPLFAEKISFCYLGTQYKGGSPIKKDATFTVVSCAAIRNIKRIHLIPSILALLDFPLKWVHIGGKNVGDPTLPVLEQQLRELEKNKPDVEVIFKGTMTNDQVLDFYISSQVNLFISVSETEGLPVSMMEAISCGIPVMSTDVGGCAEIVNEHTGFLIPREFDAKEAAAKISAFTHSEKNTPAFRNEVQDFWKKKFDAGLNQDHFIRLISSR